MAGGAELIVAWLSEGLVARGHRVTVVSTCGPEMEPYPVETRERGDGDPLLPAQRLLEFRAPGQPPTAAPLWHLRDAWNRDAGRRFRAILADAPPDVVHTHLIDGFSAAIWRRARRAGVPIVHTAHDYHLLCPRAFLLTRDWKICRQPQLGCRVYRAWHLRTARDVDLFVSPSRFLLEQHREAGLRARGSRGRAATASRCRRTSRTCAVDGAPTAEAFLLMCRLTVEKGVLRVVLQARRARCRATWTSKSVIAGSGPLEAEVRAGRGATIRASASLGYVTGEAKQALLAAGDLLLVPSLWYENAPARGDRGRRLRPWP